MKGVEWEKLSWLVFGGIAFASLFFGIWAITLPTFTDSPVLNAAILETLATVALIVFVRVRYEFQKPARWGIPGFVVGSGLGAFLKLSHDVKLMDAFTSSILLTAMIFLFAIFLWGRFVHKSDQKDH